MKFAVLVPGFRVLLPSLGLALVAATARAQAPVLPALAGRYPANTLELTAGYGAPYGWGVGVGFLVRPRLDVNVGLGASFTGVKLGAGTRYYFTPERQVSAFVGGNLVYSAGADAVGIHPDGRILARPEVVVNFRRTTLLHLRGGVRWQPRRRYALLGALGYGVALGGDPVEYVLAPATQRDRDAINFLSPGGVELSVGVAFGLGPR